jgi:hypothetical protein
MIFVSITRLRLKSAFQLVPFIWHTFKSGKQLTQSNFIKGKTLLDKNLTFWTMTLWNNEADMRAYRNTDAHKLAMPKLQHWCNEASIVHWQQDGSDFPTWIEAHQKMQSEGRASKVKSPTQDHLSFNIPVPQFSGNKERTIYPKKRV